MDRSSNSSPPSPPSPPAWIRIFKANTSTSRRTQAVAMAYTVSSITNNKPTNTAPNLRYTNINNINIPRRFTIMAVKYNDEIANNIAIVCDGGTDYNLPPSHPNVR
jgi:hypothetical protein